MEELFHYLDLKALYIIKEKAESELNHSLLRGESWQEVKYKRRLVTDLAIEIHKRAKAETSINPAEQQIRVL